MKLGVKKIFEELEQLSSLIMDIDLVLIKFKQSDFKDYDQGVINLINIQKHFTVHPNTLRLEVIALFSKEFVNNPEKVEKWCLRFINEYQGLLVDGAIQSFLWDYKKNILPNQIGLHKFKLGEVCIQNVFISVQDFFDEMRFLLDFLKKFIPEFELHHSLVYLDDFESIPSNQEPILNESKLSLKEIALLYIFNREHIDSTNSTQIAKSFNLNSGQKLEEHYNKYRVSSARINQDPEQDRVIKALIRNYEKIIPLIQNKDGEQKAQKELESLHHLLM